MKTELLQYSLGFVVTAITSFYIVPFLLILEKAETKDE